MDRRMLGAGIKAFDIKRVLELDPAFLKEEEEEKKEKEHKHDHDHGHGKVARTLTGH